MKDNTIFQFVGFETTAVFDKFIGQWEIFARKVFKKDIHAISLQQQVVTRYKFKYISKNEWPQENFQFVFMEGRLSNHFPDHEIKVIQAGGYAPLQIECDDNPGSDEIKLMAFISSENIDVDACRRLPYRNLNIYQAYYESCLYNYILEFYVDNEENAKDLLAQLKNQFSHVDIGMYKECLVLEG